MFDKTPEEYLSLIGNWKDPYPEPVITEHDGFQVVRDDVLGYGSKIRFVDYMIGHSPKTTDIKEWVFGSCPATGYAQISLPVVCNKYGKKAVLFMAKRNPENYHPFQIRGMALGADYRWIPDGMLTVTQKRARDYAMEDTNTRRVLPLGLEDDTVIASIIRVAREIKIDFPEIWSVGSSGTLSRGLQLAFPDKPVNIVSVGHKMNSREIGRATVYRSPYAFNKAIKKDEAPAYPSVSEYDAKVWPFVKEFAKPGALIWNVA